MQVNNTAASGVNASMGLQAEVSVSMQKKSNEFSAGMINKLMDGAAESTAVAANAARGVGTNINTIA